MQTISNEEIRQLLDKTVNLPSPPGIAVQILSTVQKEDFSLDDLEKIISADPALTSKLLRLANSSCYAPKSKIGNINRALSLLGTNVIKNIALSFVIAADLKNTDVSDFDFDYFWKRSVTCAVAAELVSAATGIRDEDIFVTALLQDIGVLVMFLTQGKDYLDVLKTAVCDEAVLLADVEREKFKFDHQNFGALLLEDWGLPTTITEPLRYHHTPLEAPETIRQKALVLNVSTLLSRIYSGGKAGESVRIAQERLNTFFSFDEGKTREILDNVATQSVEILKIFEIEAGDIKPYSQMLQEANDELGKLNLSYEQLVLELKESKERVESFAEELKKANSKLEKLAFRDGLTNLYNHRYFQEILAKEISRVERYGRPMALLLFDIDHFKKVNDTYGHPVGDKVLVSMSCAITKAVRPSDIIARYGGEEFAAILPETNFSGMKVFAERLRRCVEALVTQAKQHDISITISCGGAHYRPGDKITPSDLISVADRALYESKKNGRNMVTAYSISDIATHP